MTKTKKILVIEDNKTLNKLITHKLKILDIMLFL